MKSDRKNYVLMHGGRSIETVNAHIRAQQVTTVKISTSVEPVLFKSLDRSVDTFIFCRDVTQAIVEKTPGWIKYAVFESKPDYRTFKDLLPSGTKVICIDRNRERIAEDTFEADEPPKKRRRLAESKDDQEFVPTATPHPESERELDAELEEARKQERQAEQMGKQKSLKIKKTKATVAIYTALVETQEPIEPKEEKEALPVPTPPSVQFPQVFQLPYPLGLFQTPYLLPQPQFFMLPQPYPFGFFSQQLAALATQPTTPLSPTFKQ